MATVSTKKKFVADGVFKALLQVKRAPSPKGKKGQKKNGDIVLSTSDVRYNAKNSSNGTFEIEDEEQFPALGGNRNESNNPNLPENHRSENKTVPEELKPSEPSPKTEKGKKKNTKTLQEEASTFDVKPAADESQIVTIGEELKRVNHDPEAKVNELSSTCMQQKEELLRLGTQDSGSEEINQDLEAKVNDLSSTYKQQKEELSLLTSAPPPSEGSGSEDTGDTDHLLDDNLVGKVETKSDDKGLKQNLQIQGKSVEENRTTLNIEDPKWSPEELAKLKEENAWA